jgi:glycine/D-amino acid oxidase-like deaminating enzyme
MVAPAVRSERAASDVVVVGAGAFGGWTALHLAEMGRSVTLVDAYGPGNSRASSGGETRQIRVGYGARENYSRWVLRAFEMWKAREEEWGEKILFPTGRLQLAPRWTEELEATARVFEKLGVPSEVVHHDELRRRYPQMSPEGVELALFEPQAAVLKARHSMRLVADGFRRRGGTILLARSEAPAGAEGALSRLALSGGSTISAGSFVFACGPWLPKIFPELLGDKISSPRRDVFFFGTPSGDDRFDHPNFPNFSEDHYYGFPGIEGRGFKVCPVGEKTPFDPDRDERVVSAYQLKRARDYLAVRFPALADQPVAESRVCQLEMTADEHFVVQKHPRWSNVWIAGGGSGHGFKHGPVVGEYIARRVSGESPEPELEELFHVK